MGECDLFSLEFVCHRKWLLIDFFSSLPSKFYCASITSFLSRNCEVFVWLLNFRVVSI